MKLQWFQVLLALRDGTRHGYGIQRAVLDQTDGKMTLWPASLYRIIGKLEDERMIQAVPTPEGEDEDERRQYYELTGAGKRRLLKEAEIFERWAAAARGSLRP